MAKTKSTEAMCIPYVNKLVLKGTPLPFPKGKSLKISAQPGQGLMC